MSIIQVVEVFMWDLTGVCSFLRMGCGNGYHPVSICRHLKGCLPKTYDLMEAQDRAKPALGGYGMGCAQVDAGWGKVRIMAATIRPIFFGVREISLDPMR